MTQCEKDQDVAVKWEHMEVGQPFSGTDILVLPPADKHRTSMFCVSKCKYANKVEMQVWLRATYLDSIESKKYES